MKKENNKNKYLIFDMDGTLYELKGGSFSKSGLAKKVRANALSFVMSKMKKTKKEAQMILDAIKEKYGENTSIGLEKDFGIDRMSYFNKVWNISPDGIVKKNDSIAKVLASLQKDYKVILVSDSPMVWVKKVLARLGISRFFKGRIYSGEGDFKKSLGNYFEVLFKKAKINPSDCIIIGDQEKTDIVPAKNMGATAIYISKSDKSQIADYSVKNIKEIIKILETKRRTR